LEKSERSSASILSPVCALTIDKYGGTIAHIPNSKKFGAEGGGAEELGTVERLVVVQLVTKMSIKNAILLNLFMSNIALF